MELEKGEKIGKEVKIEARIFQLARTDYIILKIRQYFTIITFHARKSKENKLEQNKLILFD